MMNWPTFRYLLSISFKMAQNFLTKTKTVITDLSF